MVNLNMLESDFISFLSIKKGLHANTIKSYRSQVNRFIQFLNGRIPTQQLVEQYLYELKERKHTNHSINTSLYALVAYQKYLQDRGHAINFTTGFNTLKVERKVVDILTPPEIKRLLSTHLYSKTGKVLPSDQAYIFFTKLLAYTGARFSEISTLTVRRVYEDHLLLTETKGNEARKAYLNPVFASEIHDWIKHKRPSELVVHTRGGSPMHPGDVLVNLRKRCEIAGIQKKIYPHLFRHSFATQLAIDGAKAEEIKEILGHKDVQTSINYIHLADETLKKVTFKHSLNREALSPLDILEDIKRALKSFKLGQDNRFAVNTTESDSSLLLDIRVK